MNDGYFEVKDTKDLLQSNLYKKLMDLVYPISEKKSILECGCGKGGGSNYIKNNYIYNSYYALDVNQNHIDICKNNFNGINFVCSSATEMPFLEKTFSSIISVESSGYYSPIKKFIKKCYAALEDNGILGIASPFYKDTVFDATEYFNLVHEIDITKSVRDASLLLKSMYFDIDKHLYEVYNNDSARYFGEAVYKILVYQKKPL